MAMFVPTPSARGSERLQRVDVHFRKTVVMPDGLY